MFDFLGRNRPKANHNAPAAAPTHAAQASTTQREMVRLTLHNVLRHNGIPGNWISCDMTPVQLPPHGNTLLLQFVVHHWHDALMHYAMALEREFLEGLKRFDPHTPPHAYRLSWTFAPDCGCPHTRFPDHSLWSAGLPSTAAVKASATPAASSAPNTPVAVKPKFDLPPTAADLRKADDEDDDHGFAATQINDL